MFLFCSEHFSFVLTSMEGDRRFGYCRRMLVRQCIIHAHTLAPFTQLCSPSLLEQTLDYLKSTVSLVSGDALICTKRSVNASRGPSRSCCCLRRCWIKWRREDKLPELRCSRFWRQLTRTRFLVQWVLFLPFLTFSLFYACTCNSVLCFCDIHYYYYRGVPWELEHWRYAIHSHNKINFPQHRTTHVLCFFEKIWSMWVSISRPSRYQHDALPTEPMDHADKQHN